MNVFDCRQQEKNMTQFFETHLHFTAGIHGEVGTTSGQALWKVVAASEQVLWRALAATGQVWWSGF